ncbi:glutamate receptor 2.8-like [Rosa sericea]
MMKTPISSVCSLFLFFLFCTSDSTLAMYPVNYSVSVVLNFDTGFGKMGLSCIDMALSDWYASHPNYNTRLLLHQRNSPSDVVLSAAAALDLIKNVEVQAIIGPASSMQANFMINLGGKAHVPIISFSATSPSLTSIRSPYFFRAAQNDSSQVKAISDIIQAFGWRQVVPMYVDNEFGEGVIPYLSDALQEIDVRIPYRSVISPTATDDQIEAELYKLVTMQTRVFIVHMLPSLGSRIFEKAKEIGMMDKGYVWIVTNGISNVFGSFNSSFVTENMQGVLGLKTHVPDKKKLEAFRVRWKKKFQQDNPTAINVNLDVFGLWAYDAAKALAIAVEKVGSTKTFTYQKMNVSGSSNDLERFGVSLIGPQLVQELLGTSFRGLSGDFSLVNGQLPSSTFEIVNVIGTGENVVGFWTPENGLVRNLHSTKSISRSSASNASLGSIIWPGDTSSAPKGWQIPSNGKKLKILVPLKDGYNEFVNVTYDTSTNKTKVIGGYCLEVFEAVRKALPYDISYEFYAYAKPDGETAGSYNDLVNQVFLGNYDAAVGDITIRANRSLYVDFTLPYTESGVSMIVPIEDSKSKNAWVFLEPLTWDLWLTTGCFFIFIGFVVWVLEHRINEDFRGPISYQVGTSFWFAFSTMVFSHRERVVSNLARFVVVIWCVVVLILTQSYTASLTSMLTVQQLQPTVSDVNFLLKNGDNVGYQEGSFVYGILRQLGFRDEKLQTYNSTEDLHRLFQIGSTNGGISAAFDETPYFKVFIASYCSKYTMLDPTFKADGFAFVFPKDSPLARDVSRAILNVNEGGQAKKIEDRWFNRHSSCPDPNSKVSSNSLSLESFWGLFLIAGVASVLALLIFAGTFLYEHKDMLICSDSEDSSWKKLCDILKQYDLKDQKSHTFRREGQSQIGAESLSVEQSPQSTPCTDHGQSPRETEPQQFGEIEPAIELAQGPRGNQ